MRCRTRDGKGDYIFVTGAESYMFAVRPRTLMKEACDAGKIIVVYVRTGDQHADLFTKPLDIQKFHKHAKTVFKIV